MKIFAFAFLLLAFANLTEGEKAVAGFHLLAVTAARSKLNHSTTDEQDKATAIAETTRIVAEVVDKSYPELHGAKISVKAFRSESDFFRSQFSFTRFLTFRKLHFIIFVNPKAFSKAAPAEAIRAIIAHELAHAAYYKRHNRFELLGLINLESKSYTVRFERGADLQAIKRGYGEGLKEYRHWLYQNIPVKRIAAKRRDYFSPEEIELILSAEKTDPDLTDRLIKRVPRKLTEIQTAIKASTSN